MNWLSRRISGFVVVLFLLLAIWPSAGQAQEVDPDGPVYVVVEGDTLFGIALQFGVTVEDLLIANGLEDANQLFIGDALVIPGLAGVTGVLETRTVPFGENLRSYSRLYAISFFDLARLNRLASPNELYKGATLIVPVRPEGPPDRARAVMAPAESALEFAVRNNVNYWSFADHNRLSHASAALPGDVYALPGIEGRGPGAIPSPIRAVAITPLVQGETGIIEVRADGPVQLQGWLGDRMLQFFPSGQGNLIALQGMHVLAEPALYPMTMVGVLPSGETFAHTQMVRMRAETYLFETLVVPAELIDPETTAAESEFVSQLVVEATDEKLWQDAFQAPSPFPGCITSTFGNRRSYNGSAFNFFHGGIDFCGGQETQIFAPAHGIVVYTGYLEVRGNYTLINHGWGVFSGYMHQLDILVKPGDWIEPGDVIGLVGNTGRSTGAHLHWEVWVNQVLVNPLEWLEGSFP